MSVSNTWQRFEDFARRRTSWILGGIVAGALLLRLFAAAGTYLNADEAQILQPPLQATPLEAYRAALRFPYGPLGNLLLHVMTWFGFSELWFRLPSILAGALLPWAAYRWIAFRFDAAAGLLAAAILAFSPNLVLLAAEVRHYTIHALLLVLALDAFERSRAPSSLRWLRRGGLFLLLALLTLYMSVWFLAAMAIYAGVALLRDRARARFFAEGAAWFLGYLLIAVAAYYTHLAALQGSQGEVLAREIWLREFYFRPGEQSLPGFLYHGLETLTGYTVPTRLAPALAFVFLAGVALAAFGRAGRDRWAAVSLILPLLTAAAAGLAGVYPFGGTRHDLYLTPFIAAGLGVALSWLARGRIALLGALGALAALAALGAASPAAVLAWYRPALSHPRADLDHLLAYLDRDTAHPVLVVEQEAHALVLAYACGGRTAGFRKVTADVLTHECGRHRIVVRQVWGEPPEGLIAAYGQARSLEPETLRGPAYVIHLGLHRAPPLETPQAAAFGRLRVQHTH